MSVLSILNNIIEFIIILFIMVMMTMMRNMLSQNPSMRSLKIKKYIGYVMIAVCLIGVMDYSLVIYRLFVPANPLNIIAVDNHQIVKELTECDRAKKALDTQN